MRPIKFRAILHLDKVDEKIPAIDIMIDAVAVYPDGSIGFNEQSLKEKLPKNYEIYGDDFGAEIKYADEEGEYFETVFEMLMGEEWFWVEKDFDVMEFTGIKDKNGVEIYELMEIDNMYEVNFINSSYVLLNISNGDISQLFRYHKEKNGQIEVTKKYTKV